MVVIIVIIIKGAVPHLSDLYNFILSFFFRECVVNFLDNVFELLHHFAILVEQR